MLPSNNTVCTCQEVIQTSSLIGLDLSSYIMKPQKKENFISCERSCSAQKSVLFSRKNRLSFDAMLWNSECSALCSFSLGLMVVFASYEVIYEKWLSQQGPGDDIGLLNRLRLTSPPPRTFLFSRRQLSRRLASGLEDLSVGNVLCSKPRFHSRLRFFARCCCSNCFAHCGHSTNVLGQTGESSFSPFRMAFY